MRGVSKKAFPYIPENDRENPKDEQTVVYIKPWGGLDGAKISARYASTERIGRGGFTDMHVGKRKSADEDSFLEIVDHIENYGFSDDYPQYQKFTEDGKFKVNKKGFVESFSDEEMILAFANDITLDVFNEIVEAAANAGRLSGKDKKK